MPKKVINPEDLLLEKLAPISHNSLLILGEGFPPKTPINADLQNLTILTNRYELYTGLKEHQRETEFCDLKITGTYKHILFRTFKEKAANYYLINQATTHLEKGGSLIITGNKNEGIKNYIKRAEERLGGVAHSLIDGRGMRLGTIPLTDALGEKLDDKNYRQLRCNCLSENRQIYSKPGIFGWEKLDEGSRFLMENISIPAQSRILDLGCGYGYLSIEAWKSNPEYIVATDNNAAALKACKKNFQEFAIRGRVLEDDCGKSIEEEFDIILCNPPFHAGYKENREITEYFIDSIKEHLQPSVIAYIVVNLFIPVERILTANSLIFMEFRRNQRFKVLKISRH